MTIIASQEQNVLEKMQFYVIFLDIPESIQSVLNITRNNW